MISRLTVKEQRRSLEHLQRQQFLASKRQGRRKVQERAGISQLDAAAFKRSNDSLSMGPLLSCGLNSQALRQSMINCGQT
jgi:hypothetical protein